MVFVAGSHFWLESHCRGHVVHTCGSLLFCVSSLFLGSSNGFFGRIGSSSIHRIDQFGGKSWGVFRPDVDGKAGQPDTFFYLWSFVLGGKSLLVGHIDACRRSGAASVAEEE